MKIGKRAAVAAALVSLILVGLIASACDDDSTDSASGTTSASQETVEQLAETVAENDMFFAYISIGNIPLHAIDEGLNGGGAIEETYTPDVREFVRIMALTDWDEELAEEAETVRQSGIELLAALEDADAEAAKPLATEVHEGSHDFFETVFAHVGEGLPPEEGGPEPHEEEEGTPAADESPAAEATP